MGHPNPTIQFGITSASGDSKYRSRYPAGDWPGIEGAASGAGKASAATAAAATAAGNASASGAGKIDASTAPAATAEGSGPGLFPLAVHASKRYLVTASSNPFLVHGDTPWSIAVQLTRTQIDTYLDNRAAKGFNAILFNVVEHYFSDNSPAYKNREGNNPFTSMTDFASPNEAYFGLIDYIYNGCLSRGIWPLMNPAYLGYEGGSEGWMSEVTAESSNDLQAYGVFLANRYPLAGWCFGGDFGGNSTQRNKQWNIVTGMRTVRTTDIITGHGARTQSAYSLWNGYTGFNLNNIYTDGTEYTYAATEYARSGPMPFVLLEGYYDGTNATSADCRRQAYGSILSGACGDFFGDDPVWDFGSSSGSGGGVTSALTHLNDTSATQMSYLPPFFGAYDWHLLAPVTNTSLVTTSLGSGSSRIMPALASDGSFAMIWTPSANFTVNMTALSPSSVRARWFNPSAGTYADASGSPFSNTGTQSFTAPGERILVLDRTPGSASGPGVVVSSAAPQATADGGSEGSAGFEPDSGFSLSGTIAHGSVLELTRSSGSFGSHANYNPNSRTWKGLVHLLGLFLDFEDGVIQKNGVQLTSDTTASLSQLWTVSTSNSPAGLTRNIILACPGSEERAALEWHMPSSTGVLYTTFKIRVPANVRSGKFYRVYYTSGNGYSSTGTSDSASGLGIRYISNENTQSTYYSPLSFTAGQWSRFECVTLSGSTMQQWLDRAVATAQSGVGTLSTSRSIDFGHMIDNNSRYSGATLPNEYRFADVVHNLTRARLEIGNASSWSNCTKTEMQVPVSWSTSGIQFGNNWGEFSGSLVGKYLYFIDSNNSATRCGQFVEP